jgi:hypothetical protein
MEGAAVSQAQATWTQVLNQLGANERETALIHQQSHIMAAVLTQHVNIAILL